MNNKNEISLEDRLAEIEELMLRSEFAIPGNEISTPLEINNENNIIEDIHIGTYNLDIAIRFSKFIEERFSIDGCIIVEDMDDFNNALGQHLSPKDRINEMLIFRLEREVGKILKVYWVYDKSQDAYRFYGSFKYSDTEAALSFKSRVKYITNALFTLSYLKLDIDANTSKIKIVTKVLVEQVKNNLY